MQEKLEKDYEAEEGAHISFYATAAQQCILYYI